MPNVLFSQIHRAHPCPGHAWARFSLQFNQEIDSCGYLDHNSANFCGHAHFLAIKRLFLKIEYVGNVWALTCPKISL